ncbi:RCC1 domain-containing protein [Enterococcus sp. LJL90]
MKKIKKNKFLRILSVIVLFSVACVLLIKSASPTETKAVNSIDLPPELQVTNLDSLDLADPIEATDPGLLSSVRFIDAVALYLGGGALDDQGSVWMWGYNMYGVMGVDMAWNQGGTNRYNGGMKRVPYFTDNNIKIKKIWGAYHTMYALAEDNTMYAWGRGDKGNMGNNTLQLHNNKPVKMTGMPAGEVVDEMYVGREEDHAVYIKMESGNYYAFGSRTTFRIPNSFLPNNGATGPGVTGSAISIPQYIEPLSTLNKSDPIVSFSLGGSHALVATESGKAYSWGLNGTGQLGIGSVTSVYTLNEIPFFSNNNLKVIQVSANTDDSLALTDTGDVYNFGLIKADDNTGGSAASIIRTPTKVEIDLTSANYTPVFKKIQAGRYAELAIDQYGRVWAWASNMTYQYGSDGPSWGTTGENQLYHFDDPSYGKLAKRLYKATQVLTTLGDGDTEFRAQLGTTANPNMPVKAPVFSNLSETNQVYQLGETLSKWRSAGMWSNQLLPAANSGNRHPTIYDKRYYETTGDLLDITSAAPTDAVKANSHDKVYFVDEDGRKLVYVVLREGTSAPYTYSGNFYVAEVSYSGSWFVNRSGITDLNPSTASSSLPTGVTSETALPKVKEDERGWIEAVTDGEANDFTGTQNAAAPYADKIYTYQSYVMILDKSGNLYRSALDGSGTIAWGWDYMPQYEWNGGSHYYSDGNGLKARHAVDGLFDMYTYELMFMRGAPRINPTTTDINSPIRKIYKSESEESQKQNTDVRITLGTAVVNEQLNITIEPELTQAKYIKIPLDPNDVNSTITEPTQQQFEAAYNGSNGYEKGDLITLNGWTADDLINKSPDTSKRLSDNQHIVVTDNCVLWVMTVTHGYSDDTANISRKVYDNYYTNTTVYHDGVNVNSPNEEIYPATEKYIAKTAESKDSDDEDMTIYGLPLDKNGAVIVDPTFGYDEVAIRAFETGDPEYTQYIDGWYLLDSNLTPVKYSLDSTDYLLAKTFTHTFDYERDPSGWVTINYKGRLNGSSTDITPYLMDGITGNEGISGNQETVKKSTAGTTITMTRIPVDVPSATPLNFTVDGGSPQNLTDKKIVFNTISDRSINTMEVIIYYSQAELFLRQVISSQNNEIIVPSQGYFTLENTDGTDSGKEYNMLVNSGTGEAIGFKRVQLQTETGKDLFTINPILPEMYQYYGYRISAAEESHAAATLERAPATVSVDFSAGSKYYVTIYIEPTIANSADIPFYNWDYKMNTFGKITAP